MDMPPTRYQVVERGRRLIVVDRWNGGAPVAGMPIQQAARLDRPRQRMRAPAPSRNAARPEYLSEPRVLTTQRWFDDKGPRRVRLTEQSRTSLGIATAVLLMSALVVVAILQWFALPVFGFFLLQPGVRGAIRKGATVWLDSLDEA